jgi:hypothetical protein
MKLDSIYECLIAACKKITNIDRSNVVREFLELSYKGELYSVGEVHKIYFPEMNRNTFYAHKHYGFNFIKEECKKIYYEWR